MIAFRGSKIAQMPSAFRALPESPPKRSFAARDLPLRRRAKGDCDSPVHFSTLTPGDNLAVSILQLQNFGQPTEYWLTASLRARGMLVTEALAWSGTRLIGHAPVARMS
ncbi:MAG: hypothetical protein OIF40_04885, partial [Mangrovicoccus sp.]|nr:hypothetical protein [Mangrovicoccus sp.]